MKLPTLMILTITPPAFSLSCMFAASAFAGNLPDLKCTGASVIQGADYQYSFVLENGVGNLTETKNGQTAVTQIASKMTCSLQPGGQTPGRAGGFTQDVVSCVSWAEGAPATGFSVNIESDHDANKFKSGSAGIVLDDNSPVLPWSNSSIVAGLSCN